jgi:hypothetical protein
MKSKTYHVRAIFMALTFLIGEGVTMAAETRLSGLEVSPGFSCMPDVTCGVAFGAWTQADDSVTVWVDPTGSDGGLVSTLINYQGDPGIKSGGINSVKVIGGTWFWQQSSNDGGRTLKGLILSNGKVEWPASLTDSLLDANNIDCGPGVARFCVEISRGFNTRDGGRIAGCLDDTHLETIFPPHAWGELIVDNEADCSD